MQTHVCAELVPLFNHLDRESLVQISNISRHRRFRRGETVFSPNEHAGLLILARGRVKVYQLSASGKEQLLRVLEPGDFIGEDTLFGQGTAETFGEALTEIEACTISRTEFMELLKAYPAISLKLLEAYSHRLSEAERLLTRTATESVSARLELYLMDLAKVAGSNTVTLPLTMKELAAFLGTTPETVSRRLRQLEEAGSIARSNKQIRILKPDIMDDIM